METKFVEGHKKYFQMNNVAEVAMEMAEVMDSKLHRLGWVKMEDL